MDWTVLGMPIEPDEDLKQPLAAAVVIKGFDAEGKLSYWTACTDGLMNVEVLGMMHWGAAVALAGDEDA